MSKGFSVLYTILINFIKKTRTHRSLILAMAVREIEKRYIGTLGGLAWSIINPLMMILVYWFVFSVGFKIQPPGGIPFILIFLCGLIPWTLFNETLIKNTEVIRENSHLVTKTVFPTEILPLINFIASLITHGIMMVILLVLMVANGVAFDWINFQFLFYLGALSFFIFGLSWLLAALNVFYRDVGQILGVVLNLWFWLTPIVWLTDMIPAEHRWWLQLNPMTYIVTGYKNSFFYHVPFWEHPESGLPFWGLSLVLFMTGGMIFRKLKPEFAEVL